MNIIADTNVLLRAVLGDDPKQSGAARHALSSAERIVFSRHALCELVWVLRQSYKLPKHEVAETVRSLVNAQNAICDDGAVEAGLNAMEAGADFADGVIAYEGAWLGEATFVSFDKKAVDALVKGGHRAKLLR